MGSCDVLQIPPDSIIGNNMAGGMVYSASIDFGGFQSPSTLTLQIVNKTGNYSIPRLPGGDKFFKRMSLQSLNLGNRFYFKGYYVGYEYQKKAELKILVLKFVDGSLALGQITCGLHKLWGDKVTNKLDDLILVGKEYSPCDTNMDSTIDAEEANQQGKIDWCDPCVFCPPTPDKYDDRCKKNDYAISPIAYTINELIRELKSYGIAVRNSGAFDKFIENGNTFTGTLRSVISSWCSEFGLSFYWDYNTNSLVFVDLNEDVRINFDKYISLDNIDEYTQSESIEDTYSSGVVSYYERAGEVKDYQCSDDIILNLRPLVYQDLINIDDYKEEEGKALLRNKEFSINLSYYSSTLRECMWWFYHYGIKDPVSARNYLYDPVAAEEKSTAVGEDNKVLKELGGMKILQVAYIDENQADFVGYEDLLPKETRSLLLEQSRITSKNKECPEPNYYFVVAEFDDQFLAKQYTEENNIAQNYFGKFWIRRYSVNLCGGNNTSSKPTAVVPDGQANYYSAFSNVNGLNFADFGYKENSYIGNVLKSSDENNKSEPLSTNVGNVTYKATQSFVLGQRNSKWYPNSAELEDYAPLFDYYQNNYNFTLVGDGGRPDKFVTRYLAAKTNPNIRLLLCKIGNFDDQVTSDTIDNFLEVKDPSEVEKSKSNRKGSGNAQESIVAGKIGLTSRKCYWFTFGGFSFMSPVGANKFANDDDYGMDGVSEVTLPETKIDSNGNISLASGTVSKNTGKASSSYRALISQSSTQSVEIPKVQSNFITSVDSRGLNNEYLYKPINSQDINIFNEQSCVPSDKILKIIHENVTKYLGSEKIWPSKSVEFSMAGVVPYPISIEEGLENFTISIDENGVFTRYKISSRYAQPIGDTMYQSIVKNIFQQMTKSSTVPPYSAKSQQTYPEI